MSESSQQATDVGVAATQVRFSSEGVATAIARLDSQPPTVTGGYGGWTVTSRARRVGLTVWNGRDPIRMSVPVLFDGYVDGDGQEIMISRLSRMALPPLKGGEPPVITVSGRGLPHPGPTDWVIENLQWGTNVIQGFNGSGVMVRLRQDCVVNLIEYVADDRAAFKRLDPFSKAKGKSKSGWPKRYVVRPGDTLAKIALRFYKNAGKWHGIAKANNIRDPRNLKVGRTITIPAP